MRLPALLTADLHFVAEPASEYRWQLFPWLRKTAKEEQVKTICVLGDLVDRKDNHPAALVNRLVDEIKKTHDDTGAEIIIMAGNHDWLKDGEEFFKFLRHIDGVHYVTQPWEHPDVNGPLAMFLPFTKNPREAWSGLTSLEHCQYVFMHQTVDGSIASNGTHMPGEQLPNIFRGVAKVYSGDIHVPQVVRTPVVDVEYVGSPYHVHFGDNFKPRVVLLDRHFNAVDLRVPDMPKRVSVRATSMEHLKSFNWQRGDQGKVRLELRPEDRHQWARMRREVTDWLRSRDVEVHGIELVAIGGDGKRITHTRAMRLEGLDPQAALTRYVEDEELGGDALDIGLRLL